MKSMIDKNLQALRKLNKLSQETLAEKIGVSRQTIAKWENGESTPDIGSCEKLAEVFDVTIDDLLHYDERKNGYPVPPKGKHIFGIVTVGERGQIVIPKKARDVFDVKPGDELVILGDETQGLAMIKANAMLKFLDRIHFLKGKEDE